MKRYLIGFLVCLIITELTFSQEKQLWEALTCDTVHVSKIPINTRSIVLSLYKKQYDSINIAKRIFYMEKGVDSTHKWMLIFPENEKKIKAENSFLDSISAQYLGLLLYHTPVIYDKWEPWISPIRRKFLAKRDSLIADYEKNISLYNIRILSDLRSRETQQSYLSKGFTTASLSFHELGLATDFGLFHHKKYLKEANYYKPLDQLTQKYNLRWGGNFVDFVDIAHIQYYYNGAELIRKHPYLAIEFDFFYDRYLSRVRTKIAENKEYAVEDSKELLIEINYLRKQEPCFCEAKEVNFENIKLPEKYDEKQDLLLFLNNEEEIFLVKYPGKNWRKFKMGNWK